MRVHIACRASELSGEGDIIERGELVVKSLHEDKDLFSEVRRAGGLAVRMRKHRDITPFCSELVNLRRQRGECRTQHISVCRHDGVRYRTIINILRGKPEMYKLLIFRQM